MAQFKLVPLLLLFGVATGTFSLSHLRYHMKEFQEIDYDKYDYDSITEDDIWTYKVHLAAGIKLIESEFYMANIYNMKPGDKPWFVSIVLNKSKNELEHSYFLLKTLYFLNRDMGHQINVGIIDVDDEFTREAFEHKNLPQSIFIKDRQTYYMNWSQLGINRVLEFIQRYDEIAEDAFTEV